MTALAGTVASVILCTALLPLTQFRDLLESCALIAVLAAFFSIGHFRRAARTPNRAVRRLSTAFGAWPLIHATLFCALIFLIVGNQQTKSISLAPSDKFAQVSHAFGELKQASQAASGTSKPVFDEARIKSIERDLQNIGAELSKGSLKADRANGENSLVSSICDTLNQPLETKLFREEPYKCARASPGPDDAILQRLGRELESFANAIAVVSVRGGSPERTPVEMFRLASVSIVGAILAYSFGVILSLGRMKQLSNRLDPVDDATLKRLREAATTYLSRLNPPGELEQWLVTPLPLETFGEITPLEAVRYDRLRASLFDYIAANTPSPQAAPGVPAQAGENPQPQNDQPRLVAVGGTAYRE